MAYTICVTEEAWDDLEELWGCPSTELVAAKIDVFLQELEDDQDLLNSLTDHDFGARRKHAMHVSKWLEYWKKGADIWRVKLWALENIGLQYRIVYAYEPSVQKYHILAIVERDWDYDESHPITLRILAAYAAIYS